MAGRKKVEPLPAVERHRPVDSADASCPRCGYAAKVKGKVVTGKIVDPLKAGERTPAGLAPSDSYEDLGCDCICHDAWKMICKRIPVPRRDVDGNRIAT